MWIDVIDLRDFYASSLGLTAKRMIRRRVREIWPDVKGMRVLGLGFPTPFLNSFRIEAAATFAAMPMGQGVLHWPEEGDSRTTLVEEWELPFPDVSMDRILLVHALECAENVRPMMREVWRVLADGGRLLVVVPNRRGVWARFERTPFGHGRPYSKGQLSAVLRDNMFTPLQDAGALYAPPSRSRMLMASAPAIEGIGRHWFKGFAGVTIAEATKHIYAGHAITKRKKSYIRIPQES